MGIKEQNVIKKRLSSLKQNERLFRINAGMAWTGQIVKQTPGMLILKNPRPFHGAPSGWPDLAGWTEITITPDMIGKKIAIFTGEEVKATGKLSKIQEKFQEIIVRMGGIFRIISDV